MQQFESRGKTYNLPDTATMPHLVYASDCTLRMAESGSLLATW